MEILWIYNYAMLTNPFLLQAHKHAQRTLADFWPQSDLTKAILTHSVYSHPYLLFALLPCYKLSGTDNYFPNEREIMEEISHYPLRMSNVSRRAHLAITHIGFVSATPDFQGVGRRRSIQESLMEMKTVLIKAVLTLPSWRLK